MPTTTELDDFESFSPIMTRDELTDWFTRRLGQAPDAPDVFNVARQFYQLGAYSRALICLQYYVNFPNALTFGRHLLAYCYLSLGELESAFNEFKACAFDTFHEDWQMVVELAFEIEQARKQHNDGPKVTSNNNPILYSIDPDQLSDSIHQDGMQSDHTISGLSNIDPVTSL